MLCMLMLQPTIRCSTLPVDIPADYPLCSLRRYSKRRSALLSLALLRHTISWALLCLAILQPTVFCMYPACRYSNRLSAALLCLSILQLTIRSTGYALCSLWRYSNRPSTVLLSICRYYNQLSYVRYSTPLCLPSLQPTVRSAPRQRRHPFGARQSDSPLSSVL
jgi:hypothetical protein